MRRIEATRPPKQLGRAEDPRPNRPCLTTCPGFARGADLWEFCVYLQKSRERKANEESNWELDQAFQLFTTDAHGCIDVRPALRLEPQNGRAEQRRICD